MTEKRTLTIYIMVVTIFALVGYMTMHFFQNTSDLVVDNYIVELSADGTLTETYDYHVGIDGKYSMLYRYWEDPITYQSVLLSPYVAVVNVSCPYTAYVKEYNSNVEIVNDGDISEKSTISRKALPNEIGCYHSRYFPKGVYQLKIVYKISPPVQYDDHYYHMNIKLATEHIPYNTIRILIDDPANDIIELFAHPPMAITKNSTHYMITGSSPRNSLIEFEMVSKNISYGIQRFDDNVLDKTITANNGYTTAYIFLTGVYYVLVVVTLGFGGIILIVYFFKGREKDFVVPEYLNYVPQKRKPWIVNLLFHKTAINIDENAYHATLLDLHKRKIITIQTKNDRVEIHINNTAENVDGYESKVINFLKRWSTNNVFSAQELEHKIYEKIYDDSTAWSLKNDLQALQQHYSPKISKKFIVNGRKIPIILGVIGMVLSFILLIIFLSWGNIYPMMLPTFVFSVLFTIQAFLLVSAPPAFLGHWKNDSYKEKLEWESFKRFLSDMTQLKKYTIQDIDIWKEWLIYATALGVGKQVSKSMRALNVNIKEAMFVPAIVGSFYGIKKDYMDLLQ